MLNALRHQWFSIRQKRAWKPLHWRAQRLTASVVQHSKARVMHRSPNEVLNALRHQWFSISRQTKTTKSRKCAQRLTASVVQHAAVLIWISTGDKCSTPYGISGSASALLPQPQARDIVLNALRHQWFSIADNYTV